MEIELDLRKTVRQNLSDAYARLRILKDKRAGLVEAMKQTGKEMETTPPHIANAKSGSKYSGSHSPHAPSALSKKSCKSKWFEAYLFFTTSGGHLVVAGKNAKQNDELYAKHLAPTDLFFHADIQGAPTVILKEGQQAGDAEKHEAAQWAASYSSAWKVGASAVDVYALRPEQVSKNAPGGYVGRGAFALAGERQWFHQTPLALKIGLMEGQVRVLPAVHPAKPERMISFSPGASEKEATARQLSARLSAKADDIAPLLPGGKFSISA